MSGDFSEPPPARRALERWLTALQGFGRPAEVRAAVTPDAVVIRHGWAEGRGLERERFEGVDAIAEWCARSPREVRFHLASAPRAEGAAGAELSEGPTWTVRYRITFGDYENFGTWTVQLADDGRIRRLVHQPDDLPVEWRDGVPEGKRLPDMEETRKAQLALAERLRREVEEGRLGGPRCTTDPHEHDHGTE